MERDELRQAGPWGEDAGEMKTLLYTGYDGPYDELASITMPRMRNYAERHGYGFRVYVGSSLDVPNGIYWTGVCGALEAFKCGYDRAIYLDVDQLVTNYSYEMPQFLYAFNVSRDWGEDAVEPWHFSMCGFVATPEIKSILDAALAMEPEWRDKPFPEQGPMQWIEETMSPILIKTYPRRFFNAVPEQVCPGHVPEPWQPGDWCAHLTMLPVEERVKLARNILDTLNG